MEATFNNTNESQSSSFSNNSGEKSELMQFFEYQVNDTDWAYKDLLKAIFESEHQA
jgi:hypothetical protein